MEAAMTTRERIIQESLRLFSGKGYDGVSMREIAAAAGIKGASIYNHFKGKEDIFQAIFQEMTKQYEGAVSRMGIPQEQDEQAVHAYAAAGLEQLLQMTEGLFAFFTQNELVVMFRRLLVTEQHRSPLAAQYLREYYMEAPIQFQSRIFYGLQKEGHFRDCDADIMAMHFYSPIYYTLGRFDLGCPYEECLERLKRHVKTFCELYQREFTDCSQ